MPRQTDITMRADTAANWTSVNPVLDIGEFGYETDTRFLKIGDGATSWSGLNYVGGRHTQTTQYTVAGSYSYTIPAGAVALDVLCIGPGGAGGSGGLEPAGTIASGGAGGGGGGYFHMVLPVSAFTSPVAVTVGNTSIGGAAVIGSSALPGNAGTAGTGSKFSLNVQCAPGFPGGAGGTTTSTGGPGGNTGLITGAAGGSGTAGAVGTAGSTGSATGSCGSGGAGGGISTASVLFAGGPAYAPSFLNTAGAAGTVPGGNGSPCPTNIPGFFSGGGGGGASSTTVGGNGAVGGTGAGGGGGGAAQTGAGSSSGAGGNGGPGLVTVIALF